MEFLDLDSIKPSFTKPIKVVTLQDMSLVTKIASMANEHDMYFNSRKQICHITLLLSRGVSGNRDYDTNCKMCVILIFSNQLFYLLD